MLRSASLVSTLMLFAAGQAEGQQGKKSALRRVEYDATVVGFIPHFGGAVAVRSFDDCQGHALQAPDPDPHGMEAVLNNFAQNPMNVHVVSDSKRLGAGTQEFVVAISPINRAGSAVQKCVAVLATKSSEGVLTEFDAGNGGGVIPIRLDSGQGIDFNFQWDEAPTIAGKPLTNWPAWVKGKVKGETRVRVKYKILQDGPSRTTLKLLDVTTIG